MGVYVCECVSQIESLLVEIWPGLLRYRSEGVNHDGGISVLLQISSFLFSSSLHSIIFVCPVHKKFTQTKVQKDVPY